MENPTNIQDQNQEEEVYVFDETPTPPTEAEIAEVELKALQSQKIKDFIAEYGVNYQGMLDRFFDFKSMSKTHAAKFVCRDSERYLSVQLYNGQKFCTRMKLRDLIMFDHFVFLDYFYSEMIDRNEFFLDYQMVTKGFVKGYPFSKTENNGFLVCVDAEPITKSEVSIPKEVPSTLNFKKMEYTKDGIVIDGVFISLAEIKKNILLKRIVEEGLVLLKIKADCGLGCNPIYENIVRKKEDIYFLVKSVINRNIHFDEIFGKHGHADIILEDGDFTLVFNADEISNFLMEDVGDWDRHNSFLEVFYESLVDGAYMDEFSGAEIERMRNILYVE